jgi:hypothetical protein
MDRKLSTPDQPKRPRDRALPGLEDDAIRELESLAGDYADIRDRRQALTTEEVACKQRVMALMHEHQKTVYKRNGIEIRLEPGEETVKVKIRATDAEEGTADA